MSQFSKNLQNNLLKYIKIGQPQVQKTALVYLNRLKGFTLSFKLKFRQLYLQFHKRSKADNFYWLVNSYST